MIYFFFRVLYSDTLICTFRISSEMVILPSRAVRFNFTRRDLMAQKFGQEFSDYFLKIFFIRQLTSPKQGLKFSFLLKIIAKNASFAKNFRLNSVYFRKAVRSKSNNPFSYFILLYNMMGNTNKISCMSYFNLSESSEVFFKNLVVFFHIRQAI